MLSPYAAHTLENASIPKSCHNFPDDDAAIWSVRSVHCWWTLFNIRSITLKDPPAPRAVFRGETSNLPLPRCCASHGLGVQSAHWISFKKRTLRTKDRYPSAQTIPSWERAAEPRPSRRQHWTVTCSRFHRLLHAPPRLLHCSSSETTHLQPNQCRPCKCSTCRIPQCSAHIWVCVFRMILFTTSTLPRCGSIRVLRDYAGS